MLSQWRSPLSLDWHKGQGFSHLSPVPSIAGPTDLVSLSLPSSISQAPATHTADFPGHTLQRISQH